MADESKSDSGKKRRFKAGAGGTSEVKEKRGLNRIPQWLTVEKGMPDWLAGTVVVIAGGLLLTGFVAILVAVWPAS